MPDSWLQVQLEAPREAIADTEALLETLGALVSWTESASDEEILEPAPGAVAAVGGSPHHGTVARPMPREWISPRPSRPALGTVAGNPPSAWWRTVTGMPTGAAS